MDMNWNGVCQVQRKVRGFMETRRNQVSLESKSALQAWVQLCLLDSFRRLLLGYSMDGAFGGTLRRIRSHSFSEDVGIP
jgi:hypothetical protein